MAGVHAGWCRQSAAPPTQANLSRSGAVGSRVNVRRYFFHLAASLRSRKRARSSACSRRDLSSAGNRRYGADEVALAKPRGCRSRRRQLGSEIAVSPAQVRGRSHRPREQPSRRPADEMAMRLYRGTRFSIGTARGSLRGVSRKLHEFGTWMSRERCRGRPVLVIRFLWPRPPQQLWSGLLFWSGCTKSTARHVNCQTRQLPDTKKPRSSWGEGDRGETSARS